MSGKSFVKGAVVLSIAGILAKCLGALYRIPFGTIVSEDCLALYSMVYPIYNLLMGSVHRRDPAGDLQAGGRV